MKNETNDIISKDGNNRTSPVPGNPPSSEQEDRNNNTKNRNVEKAVHTGLEVFVLMLLVGFFLWLSMMRP